MSEFNQSGLSLIEAMLAVAVLMIGVLVTINIFPLALKISRNSEQETIASNLAQAEIENIFSLDYDNIGIGTIEAQHRLSASSSNPYYSYQRQTVSAYVDGNLNVSASDTGLKRITVTVYWVSPHLNIAKNLPISILISEK